VDDRDGGRDGAQAGKDRETAIEARSRHQARSQRDDRAARAAAEQRQRYGENAK
jgi:hypothetical protein